MAKAKVYFTSKITKEQLVKIYEKLNVEVHGNVGVKISTGELGGNNYLKPELIVDLVNKVNGTILECNTAYEGSRNTTIAHLETIKAHGFDKIAKVEIMDADGEIELPVNGKHLAVDIVGKTLPNYDYIINLAHFKGHPMGGFGGVLKNQSIGLASSNGKAYIHTSGRTKSVADMWENGFGNQIDFIESMAEAAKAVSDYMEGKILYINVMNNLSVDCDCFANPEDPCMKDIGILSSTDPVALDQACLDLILNSHDEGKDHFMERVDRQNGRHILPYAEELGLGTREYELINIDQGEKMPEYYIDLGSSTIKVYSYLDTLKLVDEHSIYFKNDFDAEKGISKTNLAELCAYFEKIKDEYDLKYYNTHIFVTGIFRKLIKERKQDLVKLFNDKFDLNFNIISHGIENYYLAKAMENNYNNKKVLIINMGGKTTELVTFANSKITSTNNLDIGVADLLNKFPKVNEKYSQNTVSEMESFVFEKLSNLNLDKDYDCAIFTGGEERFELLTGFNLVPNTLFDDNIHKYMLSLEDYIKGTEKVFNELSLEELYSLMPGNPKWMDGARSGAIIPLVLFKMANVKWIVPSDLNLINGVINDLK